MPIKCDNQCNINVDKLVYILKLKNSHHGPHIFAILKDLKSKFDNNNDIKDLIEVFVLL